MRIPKFSESTICWAVEQIQKNLRAEFDCNELQLIRVVIWLNKRELVTFGTVGLTRFRLIYRSKEWVVVLRREYHHPDGDSDILLIIGLTKFEMGKHRIFSSDGKDMIQVRLLMIDDSFALQACTIISRITKLWAFHSGCSKILFSWGSKRTS